MSIAICGIQDVTKQPEEGEEFLIFQSTLDVLNKNGNDAHFHKDVHLSTK